MDTLRPSSQHGYRILDTEPERHLDDLARLASHVRDTSMALITFVDEHRRRLDSRVGVSVSDTSSAAPESLRRLSALIPLCSTCQFTMTIPADPSTIPIVTDGVVEILEERHWASEEVIAVQVALQEAMANAIRHGCRGDVTGHVQCSVSCDEAGELVIVVRDFGSGFDPGGIADPLDPANILKPSGRGIFLIHQLMDQVQFADGGREVQMRKTKARDVMRPSTPGT